MNARFARQGLLSALGLAIVTVAFSASVAQAADRKVLVENFTADW